MSIIEGTSENFDEIVLKSSKPVLVDFGASWCPPCRALRPILDEMAQDNDIYKIVAVDIEAEPALAAAYEVSSIPCLIVFKNGSESDRRVGMQPRKRIEKMLGVR